MYPMPASGEAGATIIAPVAVVAGVVSPATSGAAGIASRIISLVGAAVDAGVSPIGGVEE
jgi:hypothetical protein